jgi:hypothetical protein
MTDQSNTTSQREAAGLPQPQDAPGAPSLHVIGAQGEPIRAIALVDDTITVGRSPTSDIVLDGEAVARSHLRITWDGAQVAVMDLGTRGGTMLNGMRVAPQVPVTWQWRSMVRVGPYWLRLDPPANPGAENRMQRNGRRNRALDLKPERIVVSAESDLLAVTPGVPTALTILVENRGKEPDTLALSVTGVPESWLPATSRTLSLGPEEQQRVTLTLDVPRDSESLAKDYALTVRAASVQHPAENGAAQVRVKVLPFDAARVDLRPRRGGGLRKARYSLLFSNNGNAPARYILSARDEEGALDAALAETRVTVEPGQSLRVPLVVSAPGIRWFGKSTSKPLQVKATQAGGEELLLAAQFAHKPVLPIWVIPLTLALIAAAIVYLLGIVKVPESTRAKLPFYGLWDANRPAELVFVTPPANALVGKPFRTVPAVVVKSAAGEVLGEYDVPLTIAIKAGTGAESATLAGTLSALPENGVASFGDLMIDAKGEGYVLTVSAAGLSADSPPFDVTSTQIEFVEVPAVTAAGAPFTAAVRVIDVDGGVPVKFNDTITLTVRLDAATEEAPADAAAADAAAATLTLTGTATMSDTIVLLGPAVTKASDGTASFADLVMTKAGDSFRLVASAAGLVSAESDLFEVTPGPAIKLALAAKLNAISRANPFALEVTALDQYGNVDTSYDKPLMVELISPNGARLRGTDEVAEFTEGVAPFTNLEIDQPGNAFQLVASSEALKGETELFSVAVSAAATEAASDAAAEGAGGAAGEGGEGGGPAGGAAAGSADGAVAGGGAAGGAGGAGDASAAAAGAEPPKDASVTVEPLTATYDAAPKPVVVVTDPPDLPVEVFYKGSGETVYPRSAVPPITAGSYDIEAVIADPAYVGRGAGTLTIEKAPATVVFSALASVYDGTAKPATTLTSPPGIALNLTYSGAGGTAYDESALPPSAPGQYTVSAESANPNYELSGSDTLIIGKATAQVALESLKQIAGSVQRPVVTTAPISATVVITYTGINGTPYKPSNVLPQDAGMYLIQAGVTHPLYQGSTSATLAVQKAEQQIVFDELKEMVYGDKPPVLEATTTAETALEVRYATSAPTSICQVSDAGKLTINGTGDCPIVASQAGDANYLPAPSVTRVLRIGRATQTLEAGTTLKDAVGFDTRQFLVYAATSAAGDRNADMPLTFASLTPDVCAIAGTPATYSNIYTGTVSIARARECVVAVRQPGNTLYLPVEMAVKVPVKKASQSISWDLPATGIYSQTFAVAASVSSGLPVKLTTVPDAGDSAPHCTILGGLVTVTGPQGKNCVLKAIVEPNENYADLKPEDLTRSVVIGAAAQAIVVDIPPPALVSFGTADFLVRARATSGMPVSFASETPTVCSVGVSGAPSTTLVSVLNTGTCRIKAGQDGKQNGAQIFNPAEELITFQVDKGPQTITLPVLPNLNYNPANLSFTVTPTATSGLPVMLVSDTPAVCRVASATVASGPHTVTVEGVGTCTLVAAQSGDTRFRPAPAVQTTFAVLRASQRLTLDNPGPQTLGTVFGMRVSSTSSLPVVLRSNTPATCSVLSSHPSIAPPLIPVRGDAVGSCTIVATQAGDSNYDPASEVTQTFATNAKPVAITLVIPQNRVYNGGAHLVGVTTNPANLPVEVTYNGSTALPVNAGTYNVVASVNTAEYQGRATGTLSVAKATASVVFSNLVQPADGTRKMPTITTFPNGLPLTVTYTGISGTLYPTSTEPPIRSGLYRVEALVVDVNFSGTGQETLAIARRAQVITFDQPDDKTYGDSDFDLAVTSTTTNTIIYSASGACSLSGIRVSLTKGGNCSVTARQAGDDIYNPVMVERIFNVAKAPLTVRATNTARAYGNPDPTFEVHYSGFVNGDTEATSLSGSPAITTSAVATNPPGVYPLMVSEGSLQSDKYTFTRVDGTLTVTKAPLVVTADNKSRGYGLANPALTFSYSGFRNGETAADLSGNPAISTSATASSAAGTYPITVSQGTLASDNYTFVYTSGTLTVTKALLTVTAEDKAREYGDPDPVFTLTYSGFRLADTAADALNGSFEITSTATLTSAAGTYAIVPGAGTARADNYEFAFVNGALTVTEIQSVLELDPPGTASTSVAVRATLSRANGGKLAGKPVTFTLAAGAIMRTCTEQTNGAGRVVCTLDLIGIAPGTYTVTAMFPNATGIVGSSDSKSLVVD